VKVDFYATLRPIVGGKTVELPVAPGITVRGLIDELVARYPPLRAELLDEHGNLYRHVHVFVNGRDAPYLADQLDTVVTPEDALAIFPQVAGGSV
jgi:molybdopterin synthase sulfur carrier subunit